MKKIRLLAVFTLALFAKVAIGQDLQVSGVVLDETQMPLIGVVVSVAGTSNAVATDVDGYYSLSGVPTDGTLLFTYAGMEDVSETVNGRQEINVEMVSGALLADAVVVTALGLKRPTRSLGYAVQEVDGEELLETRTVNLANALDGKIAGLQVVKGGGGPAGSSKIILRGQSSLTGSNQPLIVVDGIPMDNFSGGGLDFYGVNSGVDYGSGLNDINPEDIESFTVLKGASAAALYGSRAGNGVILITTKSGRATSGLGITVSGGIALQEIFVQPELQNSFSQGLNGVYDREEINSWGIAANVGNQADVWNKALNGWATGDVNTYDNVGNFYRMGVYDTESISFQQQVGKTSVYASLNRLNDVSMIPQTNLNRTSITARATTNLGESDKWKLDFKVNYINSQAHNRPADGTSSNNPFYTLNTMPRSINITDFENPILPDGTQIWWQNPTSTSTNNPYWVLNRKVNEDERNRFLSFISLAYDFTDWLSLEVKGGMDYYGNFRTDKQYAGSRSSLTNGAYEESTSTFLEANYSFLATAQKDYLFGLFGGAFTFGGNMMDQTSRGVSGNSGEFLVPDVFSLNNGLERPTMSSYNIRRKMNSLYGSLSINYNRAVFLDATLRNDWSSTMSEANRSFMYPSVGTSIVISDLVDEMPLWFDFAKVRASFAQVGNDLNPYQLYTTYGVSTDVLGNYQADRGDILFNSDVRSELISSWEVGAEMRFLQSRLRVDVAWYKSNATNQLLTLPLDAATGYTGMMINAGNIQNEGIEVSLGASIFRNPDGFNWDALLNFTHNKNTIEELYGDIQVYGLATIEDNVSVVARIGSSYGDIYGPQFERVRDKDSPYYNRLLLNAEGLPQKVYNGYGDVTTGDVGSYLGNQQPDFMIGLNNSFSWRGINLDLSIDARIGGEIYSLTNAMTHIRGTAAGTAPGGARETFVVDGVISDGNGGYTESTIPVTPEQYYNQALGSNNLGIAEPYVYDATNVRLRTLSLGYSLPKSLLEGSALQRVKLSFTANNLWMIYSAVPGIDPESVSGTGTNATGLELGVPPTTRSFTFNITLGF